MPRASTPRYLKLVTHGFNDKNVDGLIEHFRDKERRKDLFEEFKELEILYEITSPDAFLRPYLDDYTSLASIYAVVAKAYTSRYTSIRHSSERRTSWCKHVVYSDGDGYVFDRDWVEENSHEAGCSVNREPRFGDPIVLSGDFSLEVPEHLPDPQFDWKQACYSKRRDCIFCYITEDVSYA